VDAAGAGVGEQLRRAVVTLDRDFGNPFRFDPAPTPGIAVLRVPDLPRRSDLLRGAAVLCEAIGRADMQGRFVGGRSDSRPPV
jgi:hypothetical protein